MNKEKLIKYLINNRANAYNGKQFLLSSNRDPNIKGIDELIKKTYSVIKFFKSQLIILKFIL
ncbi:hypothetical protein [Spiroplasma endosymbiont of Colias croceus]|uniref:hypothetical protein n=1 Tax=Spiroplasma endosymbiont of Colias croceus TaxID=3066310 RepID=UPI0030D31732